MAKKKAIKYSSEERAKIAKRNAILKFTGICVGVTVLFVLCFTAAMKITASKTHTVKEGYMVVTDIPGVTFEVLKSISDYSTEIKEINKNSVLENAVTYSYKDNSLYLIFNLYNFIIVAQRGTSFQFGERDVASALSATSLHGIWFSEYGDDPVNESGNGVYSINVAAEVVITNQSYNDFYGTLTTLVGDDGEEWSLFTGYTERAQDEYQDIMDYIASTFALAKLDESDVIETRSIESEEVESEEAESVETEAEESTETRQESSEAESSDVEPVEPETVESASESLKSSESTAIFESTATTKTVSAGDTD